jgi:hypothetical protein
MNIYSCWKSNPDLPTNILVAVLNELYSNNIFIYLLDCLLNSPKVNYKSRTKRQIKQSHIHIRQSKLTGNNNIHLVQSHQSSCGKKKNIYIYML